MNLIRKWLACRRLEADVIRRRNSFAIQDYAKRREAALKYTRKEARS